MTSILEYSKLYLLSDEKLFPTLLGLEMPPSFGKNTRFLIIDLT